MLRSLHIRNYLLIDELDLQLHEGLSMITGETGSGKSIVIGALALSMGERADTNVLRDPLKRCVIELEADLHRLALRPWFDSNELPYEEHSIIRRQLEPNGRSRAFINDTPVRLEQLRELGARLVHVHSQHHTLLLNDPRFQLGLVDHTAGQAVRCAQYTVAYRQWRAVQKELETLRAQSEKAAAELDLIQFQLKELDEAALTAEEQSNIEQDLALAENSGDLIRSLATVAEGINDERGVLNALLHVRQALAKSARFHPGVAALLTRIDPVQIELQDIGSEAEQLAANVEMDPAEAEKLRDRLDVILRLQQKHRVKSNQELLELQESLRSRAENIVAMDERIPLLEKEVSLKEAEIRQVAGILSKARSKAALELATRVQDILHQLGMEHAIFRFEHRITEEPGPFGIDSIKAMFSANSDRPPAPLDKVASGGELGRVMLALISLAADSQDLPTVIFDEIDTGVSGEVADKVGSLMARMGNDRQVLAITHLPQIASKAAHHMLVTKHTSGSTVHSRIALLDHAGRVEAIAQMLSGRKLTKAALENARVLLEQR